MGRGGVLEACRVMRSPKNRIGNRSVGVDYKSSAEMGKWSTELPNALVKGSCQKEMTKRRGDVWSLCSVLYVSKA
jgi:hypothetical protein